MPWLPGWVSEELAKHHVRIERYGRDHRGAPTMQERRWYFCGHYWHVARRGRVVEGPHGPFPCESAAAVDAMDKLGIGTQAPPAEVVAFRRRA